jgi:hypothetical protein
MPTLERLDVQLSGLGAILANRRVAVPPYQRLYAWTDTEIDDLFRDLSDAIRKQESEYFLGTIVLTKSDFSHQMIIDGQQRLTTTSILICAIRDYFSRRGDSERARTLQDDYLAKKDFETLEVTPRIRLNDRDHEFYCQRILAIAPEERQKAKPETPSQKLLDEAAAKACTFVQQLVSTTQEPHIILIEWIKYIKEKAKVIVVEVANEANAFTIFEVLNDRGLDLSVVDLLKNFLFKQAGDRVSEAQTSWVNITAVLEALGERDVIKTFIRHVWSSRHGLTREKDLYDAIRKQITSKQSAITCIKDLEQKAKIYAALGNPGHEYWKPYGSTVSQAVEALGTLRAIQIRPLLIAVLSAFDPKEIRRSLPMLVAWTVRFLIVGASGSGPLETNYSERAKEVSDGTIRTASALWKAMQQIVPLDDIFREEFARATVSTQYLARYYLGVIEAYQQGGTEEIIVNPSEEKVTLEHILPQTPSPAWAHSALWADFLDPSPWLQGPARDALAV